MYIHLVAASFFQENYNFMIEVSTYLQRKELVAFDKSWFSYLKST